MCFFIFLGLTVLFGFCLCVAESAILPPDHNVDCEHYDEKQCQSRGDCAIKIEHCKFDSDKPPSCYVLWSRDEITGKIQPIYTIFIRLCSICYQENAVY